jgi:hypothetical protein
MYRKLWIFCCLLLGLVAAACGGGASKGSYEPQTPAGYGGAAPSNAAKSVSASSELGRSDVSPSAPAPSGGGRGESSASVSPSTPSADRAPEPRERPGLGTEWGESRESRVHDVSFARADSSRPFALAQFFYNDRAGVDALIGFHRDTTSRSRELSTAGGAVTVSIRDGAGDSLDAIKIGDRTYVIGQAGSRYSIVLQNHTSHRFEAVATVDGLDVINGKDGSLSNRGYVLMPFATLEIDGFRQSRDAVAAFRFSAVSDSYASQMGKGRNIGVIGVALFNERGDTVITDGELRTRDTASPFPADPRFAPPPPRR